MTSVQEQDVEGVRVLRVSGSLTQQEIEQIEPAFEAALPDGVRAVVDLGGVDLITTPGIALIISVSKRLQSTQGKVVFAATPGVVLDVLRRCKLDEVLDLADDRRDAIERAKS